ncbi:hypothetical protein A6A04_04530 [Paramagnetospirillum marisnigri]|uniref:Uncharacterized protein n=1 Tax=Paramagnetospirillum marisnigri TaxID=1285242 RepID=A0A178MH64_9PROT|nr:hypothetical protein [Paramagnetospirillum marisnigri]OAN48030.1 hypothetical protein A6A04_04530 [Paramagnetospirillum marisnigri]
MPHRRAFRLRKTKATRDKLIAAFLLGTGLFTPPLLTLFMSGSRVMGVPLFYLYVFVAWISLTALLGLIAERDSGE